MTKWMAKFMNNASEIGLCQICLETRIHNASYHNRKIENVPTLWRKDKIKDRIASHGETFKEYMIKKHLMENFSRVNPKYAKYRQSGKGNGLYSSELATMSL
jgi:hypothetical protein